ncbi:MAG: hypothetical protein ACPGUZ_02135 [Holosporaceae bacterium]
MCLTCTMLWITPFVPLGVLMQSNALWAPPSHATQKRASRNNRSITQSFLPQKQKKAVPLDTSADVEDSALSTPSVCSADQRQQCIYSCQQACLEHQSLRPFATRHGLVRVTNAVCSQDCREICNMPKKAITKERRGLRSPLVYYVLNFYQNESCMPEDQSFAAQFQRWWKNFKKATGAWLASLITKSSKDAQQSDDLVQEMEEGLRFEPKEKAEEGKKRKAIPQAARPTRSDSKQTTLKQAQPRPKKPPKKPSASVR